MGPKSFAINAAAGIESVKTMELESSIPNGRFLPIGHWKIGVCRKNAPPK